MGLFLRETETAPCTVTISHRFEELSAHVRLDNGAVIYPGDTVQVQGPEIMAAFGELIEEKRKRRTDEKNAFKQEVDLVERLK